MAVPVVYCSMGLSGGTRLPALHLVEFHGIPENGPRQQSAKNMVAHIDKAFTNTKENTKKRRRINTGSRDSLDPKVIEYL
jgi:hypothetical protein